MIEDRGHHFHRASIQRYVCCKCGGFGIIGLPNVDCPSKDDSRCDLVEAKLIVGWSRAETSEGLDSFVFEGEEEL